MAEPVELTRDLLMDAGGWKEMKAARQMHRAGLVTEASYEGGVLSGVVRGGGKSTKVRMEILSRTHMENRCACFMARRDGRVCAHAIAVGLEVIAPSAPPEPPLGNAVEGAPEVVEDRWPCFTEEGTEEAVPVRCSLMLPLHVERSWQAGSLMVGVAAEEDGESRLVGALGTGETYFVGERDMAVLRALKEIFPGEAPGVATLGRVQFLALLEAAAGHPRVACGKKKPATVLPQPLRLSLGMKHSRIRANWPTKATPLVDGGRAWAMADEVFRPVAPGLPAGWAEVLGGGLVVSPSEAAEVLRGLERWFEVEPDLFATLPQPLVPQVELELEGSLNHLEGTVTFVYGRHRRLAGDREPELIELEEGGEGLTSADLESVAADALRQWGFDGPGRRGKFILRDQQQILRFHAHGLGRLDPAWEVRKGERFEHAAANVVPVAPVLEYRGSGEDWFAIETGFQTAGGEEVPRDEIQRLLRSGRVDRPLRHGKIAVLDLEQVEEVGETLADCEPDQTQPGVFRIGIRQAAYLRQAAADLGVAGSERIAPERTASGDLDERLGELGQVLRPYQREGVEWMWGLAELGMGGILADDMGLGKTLQTLSFLFARGGTALVVCPSSLVANWIAEAAKFVPTMRTVAVVGRGRLEALRRAGEADLLVTSYALLRRDAGHYRDREFTTVVLDEAQQIKNPDAQVSKAAFGLRAPLRFALTGTPLENSVKDLWSIMHFVLPGYLGERREFGERFEKPLASGKAPALQRRLARRLRPVLKRRLKQEVAPELPERIEQIRYCELTAKQRGVYEAILRESRTMIGDAEGGRKRMMALTALLRLRQACCDLRLLDLPDFDPEEASIKMRELEALLLEAVEGGHRVLVFSQFVQMLQALIPMLAENGLASCYLDGQTKKRWEEVERFQNTPEIPVFLISLKAGGLGLNLTGADTVIHLDPWWYPAVEAQATDRAHRIGQERVVTSYKLITRDTVEEKILALQERKRELVAATLDSQVSSGALSLSEEEVFELFT